MGKIKQGTQEAKEYTLTEREFNLLKIANLGLMYSSLKDKTISGILYIICHARFDYPENVNLIFEVDLEDDRRILKVSEVSTDVIKQELNKRIN